MFTDYLYILLILTTADDLDFEPAPAPAPQRLACNAQTDASSCNNQSSSPVPSASTAHGSPVLVSSTDNSAAPTPNISNKTSRASQSSPGSKTSSPPLVRRPCRQRQRRWSPISTDSPLCTTDTSALDATTTEATTPTPQLETFNHTTAAEDHLVPPPPSTLEDNIQPQVGSQTDQPSTNSSTAAPPPWVIAWRDHFDCALDIDMLEVMVSNLTHLAQSMAPQRHVTRNSHQQHRRQPRPQRSGNNQRPNNYDAAEASRIQRLYCANKGKAFKEITRGPSRFCNINKATLTEHFTNTNSCRRIPQEPFAASLPPGPLPTSNDPLCGAFTPAEVAKRFAKCRNTTAEPDGIRYYVWRRLDPQEHILSALFNAVLRIGATPTTWKTSTTILLHKKGNRDNIANWKPIALANILGKLYSACITSRLLRWCEKSDIISAVQKGFKRYNGCSEHNFNLQSAIQDARRKNHGCHMRAEGIGMA
ncbi:uncharacterized protein LOC111628484 [Centruroides sculpturatus]|uniref:uncharacterized protein LOC111628484 n=1 Tax=Centruroides sculpturatus TaxID=218467 RepID=UPI000C6DD32C|nr:uncharacterized protein LOC111628484 [Centruroides sculpturatus]